MAPTVPVYDVMVRRTHKFFLHVQTNDPNKINNLAKDAVKNMAPVKDGDDSASLPTEYDVNFTVKSEAFDPDAIP